MTYRMGLVEIEVSSVFLLDGDDFRQLDDGALHGVDALDDDEDLLPWPPCSGVASDDCGSQESFEALDVAAKNPLEFIKRPSIV